MPALVRAISGRICFLCRFFSTSKNADDWPMKSPSAVGSLAAPTVLVRRIIEHPGNFRLRNIVRSGRSDWPGSPPGQKGAELRSRNTSPSPDFSPRSARNLQFSQICVQPCLPCLKRGSGIAHAILLTPKESLGEGRTKRR